MAAQGSLSTSGSALPDISTLAIKNGDKKVKEPSFSSPSQMVTFVIGKGEKKETFIVHKEHACKYSYILEKAFNSEFQEGLTQTYEMEDTTPETFRLFTTWLYTQKIPDQHEECKFSDTVSSARLDDILKCADVTFSHYRLWVLAEKFIIPRLQNEVMDVLNHTGSREICCYPLSGWLDYVYENTAVKSPLRQFIVNFNAWGCPARDYNLYPTNYPKGFLLDLATVLKAAVSKRAAADRPHKTNITEYYVEER